MPGLLFLKYCQLPGMLVHSRLRVELFPSYAMKIFENVLSTATA